MSDTQPLKPADIAKLFNQSLAWVSKNHKKLGGVKIGGRMFFPPREILYERLFCGKERVAVRLYDEEPEVYSGVVPNQERSIKSRARKEKRVEQTDLNRHGLFDLD